MKGLSDHTLLMNKMVGLCKRIRGWSSTLRDLGYSVELVEPRFVNSEGKTVNPDLMFTSNRLIHTLITECKGGSIDENQLEKYTKITLDSILPKVSVYDPRRLTFDLSYAITEKILEEAAKKLGHHDLPILIFSETHITKQNIFQNNATGKRLRLTNRNPGKTPNLLLPLQRPRPQSNHRHAHFPNTSSPNTKKKPDEPLEIEPETILSRTHKIWEHIDESRKRILR